MEKGDTKSNEDKDVNPNIRFIFKNQTVVNFILYFSTIVTFILIVIAVLRGWFDRELSINIILMIIGSFLGASLFKYANRR